MTPILSAEGSQSARISSALALKSAICVRARVPRPINARIVVAKAATILVRMLIWRQKNILPCPLPLEIAGCRLPVIDRPGADRQSQPQRQATDTFQVAGSVRIAGLDHIGQHDHRLEVSRAGVE